APGYSAWMERALTRRFARLVGPGARSPSPQLLFEEVNWSAALQSREDRLWQRLLPDGPMRYKRLRRFVVDFPADAVAYQPAPSAPPAQPPPRMDQWLRPRRCDRVPAPGAERLLPRRRHRGPAGRRGLHLHPLESALARRVLERRKGRRRDRGIPGRGMARGQRPGGGLGAAPRGAGAGGEGV